MAERNSANESKPSTTTEGGTTMRQQRGSTHDAGGRQASQGGSMGEGRTSELASEFEALKHDLAQVRRDLSDLADAGRSTLGHGVRGAREGAMGVRDQARDQAKDVMGRVRDTSSSAMRAESEMLDDVRRRVGEHPATSMAVAMGVGFLVGWIASRSGGGSRDHGHPHDRGPEHGYGYGGRYPY